MSENDKQYKRNLKSTLVEPFKQIKFGVYVIGISVSFVAVCAWMFVAAFTEQYQHVMSLFNVVNPELKWEFVMNDVFQNNAIRIGYLFVAYIFILFLMVFRLTHRYYGPLVSINRFVDQITNGDYTQRAKIRNKDELHDLVDRLNAMAEELQKRHGDYHGDAKKKDNQKAS